MINYFLAAAMAAAIIWIVAVFNSVIRRKNMVENAFASIDAMTQEAL